MGKSTISMAIFKSYVSLPEGTALKNCRTSRQSAQRSKSQNRDGWAFAGWWMVEFSASGIRIPGCGLHTVGLCGFKGRLRLLPRCFFGILSWNCKKGCSVFCNLSPWELCSEREVEPLQCLRSLLEENRKLKEEAEAIFDVTLSINLDLWRRGPHRESERERCFPGGTMVIFCQ